MERDVSGHNCSFLSVKKSNWPPSLQGQFVSDQHPGWETILLTVHPCPWPPEVLTSIQGPRHDMQLLLDSWVKRPELGDCRAAGLGSPQPTTLRCPGACPHTRLPFLVCTKRLRCIAFMGIKPWTGRSEVSAFFRSIVAQRV